jgi:DNA modification methylase
MPESVTDRPTKSHEYIFLMTKNARYYYDHKAILEPVSDVSLKRAEYGWDSDRPSTKNASMGGTGIHVEQMGTRFVNPEGRNKRTVWTITTKGYPEAHFATYPPDLILPCILAGSKEGDTVLDPFSGSGTTGEVALKHGRNYIGLELNPEYAAISEKRISNAIGMFGEIQVT